MLMPLRMVRYAESRLYIGQWGQRVPMRNWCGVASNRTAIREEGKKSRWTERLERVALIVGLVSGVTALAWQFQERIEKNRETFVAYFADLERVSDSLYVIRLDLLNTSSRAVTIQDVSFSGTTQSHSTPGWGESYILDSAGKVLPLVRQSGLPTEIAAGPVRIEPDNHQEFRSAVFSLSELRQIANLGTYVTVRTMRATATVRVDVRGLRLAIQNLERRFRVDAEIRDRVRAIFGDSMMSD